MEALKLNFTNQQKVSFCLKKPVKLTNQPTQINSLVRQRINVVLL